MPKYLIERDISGAGQLTAQQLQEISEKSCCVLSEMGSRIQWLHSYVCEDKVYCVYLAPNAEAIVEHGLKGGFPVSKISLIKAVIDPSTAEI